MEGHGAVPFSWQEKEIILPHPVVLELSVGVRYRTRSDEAGRFARRLLRKMDSLWVFLSHHGVEPTNNRGERALRFGVQWRKRSLGTASDKGNRWVERILSLKETCRLRTVSTYHVLVDALSSFFGGQQPDLAWLQLHAQSSTFNPVIAHHHLCSLPQANIWLEQMIGQGYRSPVTDLTPLIKGERVF